MLALLNDYQTSMRSTVLISSDKIADFLKHYFNCVNFKRASILAKQLSKRNLVAATGGGGAFLTCLEVQQNIVRAELSANFSLLMTPRSGSYFQSMLTGHSVGA